MSSSATQQSTAAEVSEPTTLASHPPTAQQPVASCSSTSSPSTQYNQEIYPKPLQPPLDANPPPGNNESGPNTANSSESSSSSSHFRKGEGIPEPRPTDVICGRGKMTASHPANRRFRELVDSHKASYQNSKRRDEKTRITCELVDKLRGEGRFVLFDPNTKLWHEVSEEYAREKVSHSLRSRSSSEQRTGSGNHGIHTTSSTTNTTASTNSIGNSESSEAAITIAPRTSETSDPVATSSTANGSIAIASKPRIHAGVPSSTRGAVNGSSANTTATTNVGGGTSNSVGTSSSTANPSSSAKKTAVTISRKKTATTAKSSAAAAVKAQSSGSKSKHSLVRPGLDEIVKRLICDQQELLRGMIEKEKERFTSSHGASATAMAAAVMGSQHRSSSSSQPLLQQQQQQQQQHILPLSYRAEAVAVSALTTSLPKMGTAMPKAAKGNTFNTATMVAANGALSTTAVTGSDTSGSTVTKSSSSTATTSASATAPATVPAI